jgi:hypothetical protein
MRLVPVHRTAVEFMVAADVVEKALTQSFSQKATAAAAWLGSRPAVRSVSLQSPTRAY